MSKVAATAVAAAAVASAGASAGATESSHQRVGGSGMGTGYNFRPTGQTSVPTALHAPTPIRALPPPPASTSSSMTTSIPPVVASISPSQRKPFPPLKQSVPQAPAFTAPVPKKASIFKKKKAPMKKKAKIDAGAEFEL